jgi:hypothetical protein
MEANTLLQQRNKTSLRLDHLQAEIRKKNNFSLNLIVERFHIEFSHNLNSWLDKMLRRQALGKNYKITTPLTFAN